MRQFSFPALVIALLGMCAGWFVSCGPTIVPVSRTSSATATPTPRVGQHPYSAQVTVETSDHLTRTVRVDFLLYLPPRYTKDAPQKWPLILFLHGRGERGSDLDLLKNHPLPRMLAQQVDFPFIVVSPQRPLDGFWWSDLIEPLKSLLDQIETEYSVDPRRVYLTGLSMGGFGAWEFALRYPRRFAAVVPIAGGYREASRAVPDDICKLRHLPIWVFHGDSDDVVRSYQSELLVEALRACGGNVRFTLYAGVGHEGSWTRAYADPELYLWLSAQTNGEELE